MASVSTSRRTAPVLAFASAILATLPDSCPLSISAWMAPILFWAAVHALARRARLVGVTSTSAATRTVPRPVSISMSSGS